MSIEVPERNAIVETVRATVARHGAKKEELIPILNDVNSQLGYVPAEAMEEISQLLRVPKSQLFGVATFYEMIATKPRGRHVVKFCESAPCHVVGGRQVWQSLQESLQIQSGETSPDGKWTLLTTSCLGVCGVGPVIIIDEDIYGNVTPSQIDDILARYA